MLQAVQDRIPLAVDYYATWCGPCKKIGPVFDGLSQEHDHIRCVRVDVDKCKEVAMKFEITMLPTFHFYFQGSIVGKVFGADEDSLREEFVKIAAMNEEELLELVDSLEKDQTNAEGNVNRLIDKPQLEALNFENVLDYEAFSDITGEETTEYLSDCDEQFIINMRFSKTTMLKGIRFFASDVSGPKTIKLFVNEPNMDFDDAENNTPTQVLNINPSDLEAEADYMPLNVVKFSKVNHLSIFCEDNQQDQDQTSFYKININGKAV
eukprot:TRINITY_DN11266_c0_g1_i1.p1 TRINITY_DN11266_c0_g1~~TRINITY_DN11266_c0_g1_i1.p1  ORF type:complete len:284 (+),score=68.36 TRINITY_DN11266_c0_g1_i1:60-854(+)